MFLGGTLPVPFNIIPTPKSFYYLYQRIFQRRKNSSTPPNDHYHSTDANNALPVMIRRTPPSLPAGKHHGNAPIATISNGQMASAADKQAARRKSFDSNQTLTYRKVMERVIKRFLLHKQREEQDEIREGDFEELKQDIQMLRFEMMNRLDETRDDLAKNSLLLNEGVLVVGELLASLSRDSNPLIRDNFHLFKKNFYSTLDKMRSVDSGLETSDTATNLSQMSSVTSAMSMPNIAHQMNAIRALPTSSSDPVLSTHDASDSDVNPLQVIRHLSAAHVTLSNIVEENEDEEHSPKRTHELAVVEQADEEEEEVEARHMSIQTSADEGDDGVVVLKL